MSTAIERATPVPAIDREQVLSILRLNPRDPQVQALLLTCERYGLDPILKHAVLIQGRLYVTRDGLLHVAHSSGRLDGIEVLEQSETTNHWQAKVAVFRKDMTHAFAYVGRYPKDGANKTYGPEMAVKCAEVMALRRAFDVAVAAREEAWETESTYETSEGAAGVLADAPASSDASPADRGTDDPADGGSGRGGAGSGNEAGSDSDSPSVAQLWKALREFEGSNNAARQVVNEVSGKGYTPNTIGNATVEELQAALARHRVKADA